MQSINNKTCIIRDLITENSIDLFCVTETWLNPTDTSTIASFLPDTHKFYHFPRENKRGGGVGVAAARFFSGTKSFNRNFNTFECLEVNFSYASVKMAIYRSSGNVSSQFFVEFESFLSETALKHEKVIYLGDFNIWYEQHENSTSLRFRTLLESFIVVNFVNSPTHDAGHTLDLVLSNCNDLITGTTVDSICSVSDHRIVNFKLNCKVDPVIRKNIKFRNYRSIDPAEFSDSLVSGICEEFGNLNCAHQIGDALNCVDCHVSTYRKVSIDFIDRVAPVIEKVISVKDNGKPWYNSDIRIAKRNMRRAEKKYRSRKTMENGTNFRRLKQLKCNLVRVTKSGFFQNKLRECSGNSKEQYKLVNELLGKNLFENVLPVSCGDVNLANNFKNFFINKIADINASFVNFNIRCDTFVGAQDIFLNDFMFLTLDDVQRIFRNLKKTNCYNDPYDIGKVNFNDISIYLASIFAQIANKSFLNGIFPDSEKYAIVRPLIKGNKDPDCFSSYRPLYNTSYLSKFLESAALEQLVAYLNSFESFSKYQSSYRQFHSVETAITKIYNDLIINKAQGKCTLLILLDLSAAFDTVNHSLLLNDLHNLGIGGRVLDWFRSYLLNREFSVLINDTLSDRGRMDTGVPQGSILGPVLFIIYTTQLHSILNQFNVSFHFYADDTQIYLEVENLEENLDLIRNVYGLVRDWMYDRKLKMNIEKTECILIGSSVNLRNCTSLESFTIDDIQIALSNKVKSLGVVFDEHLSMRDQVSNVKKKVYGNLINLSRISGFLDRDTRLKLVHGLVLSSLDFCNSIYYGLPNSVLHGLQIALNAAARLVMDMPRYSRDSVTAICIDLHFLPIRARIEYKICLLTYKAVKFGQPKYLADLLAPKVQNPIHHLRSSEDAEMLHEPFLFRVQVGDRSFASCAPRLYNSLPLRIRSITEINAFKKELKTHLFLNAYDFNLRTIKSPYLA